MLSNIKHCSVSHLLFVVGIALSSLGLFSSSAPAQTESPEKPKLKHFGSSLDRLRWDPEKQAAVEYKDPVKPTGASEDLDVVRVQTDLVVFDVQVRDRQGRVIAGLTQNDFIVTEDGGRQSVGHFSLGDDLAVSRSIVLIIDYSGSLRSYMDKSLDAAKVLVDKLAPKDDMAIVTDDVELVADFTRDKEKLRESLESLRHKVKDRKYGRSFQWTALMATARELFSDEDIRPIVIFQTDGDEVGLLQPPDPRYYFLPELPANAPPEQKKLFERMLSRSRQTVESQFKPFSLKDVYHAVEKSRATVYTVIPGQQLLGLSNSEQVARVRSAASLAYSDQQLEEILKIQLRAQTAAAGVAVTSGGWTAFLDKPEQAADIYSTILADINSRYVIGYYPTNKVHDGRRRNVSVEVREHPEYVVSGRKSYYAQGPD